MTPRNSIHITALLCAFCLDAHAAQQSLTLNRGWNLVSFYVQPADPAVDSVFSNVIAQNRLLSVFAYEYSGFPKKGGWKRFYPSQPPERAWVNTLTSIKPMQGYWVNLANGLSVTVTATGAVTTIQQVVLEPGWNLIGLGNNTDVFWADAIGSSAGAMQAVFGFDYSVYSFQGFSDPTFRQADINGDGNVAANEFDWVYNNQVGLATTLRPGSGYWVKVGAPIVIEPVLEVELESDVDPFVPGATNNWWFQPGVDTDLNGNGVLDYGFTMIDALIGLPQLDPYGNPYENTQDTIWFRTPTGAAHSSLVVLQQDITVLNSGNGGFLHFDVTADVPWLTVAPASGSLPPGVGGKIVELQANMIGLPNGTNTGTLRVRSNGGEKTYTLRLTVPQLDDIYAGEVTITNIQGRATTSVDWPIQLKLNLAGASIIMTNGSPLFPQDVPLANNGTSSQFDLAGSVSMAANDPKNHYGRPFQRRIRLRGGRVQPPQDLALGHNLGLAGEYEETITGLPGGPLVQHGIFSLTTKTDKQALEEP